jgi:hypothetical protein
MVLDLAASRGNCRVGFSANKLIVAFEVPAPVSVTFPRYEVCESQGYKVGTGLCFKRRGLRSGYVVALFAAHIDKGLATLSSGGG